MHLVLNSRLGVFKPQSAREWRHSIGEILGKGGKSNYFRLFWGLFVPANILE